MRILKNTKIDFLRWRVHAVAFSLLLIVGGIATMVSRGGLPLGVEFTGGTVLILQFDQPVNEDEVRGAIASIPGDKTVQAYATADDAVNQMLIRLPQLVEVEQGAELQAAADQVSELLRAADLPSFTPIDATAIGPAIGADLQRKGIWATITALGGILLYVALRFRFTFAVGAVIAVIHDILITLTFLTWFGYELSLNVIAAILTITGYSVNDTIVVFDRVRENTRLLRREGMDSLINTSVNQTLARTVITSGTTFLAVLGLYLYGGDALEGFAFTLMVGVLSGTYSTVFIAAAIAVFLSGRKKPPAAGSAGRARAGKATRAS